MDSILVNISVMTGMAYIAMVAQIRVRLRQDGNVQVGTHLTKILALKFVDLV